MSMLGIAIWYTCTAHCAIWQLAYSLWKYHMLKPKIYLLLLVVSGEITKVSATTGDL